MAQLVTSPITLVYTTYAYDQANRLLNSYQGGNVTTYLYDANGNLTAQQGWTCYGPSDEHYGGENATGTVMRAGGQVAPPVTMTHYGGQWADPNNMSGVSNPYQFGGEVGYYQDTPTCFQVRARSLATDTGRWLSRDPLGFDGDDINLYRYVGNDPINGIDPSGMDPYISGPGYR